ncbi:hypothetical protein Tco_1435869, partial [Tanacetum coccineum]
MLLLTWHDFSEPTKGPICEFVTPRSLPQHDSSTPCKDYVCESVTPRRMTHCMLTTPTDESVIEDVMRQLSFEETELDGEAGFSDVVGSFGVDDLNLNLNEHVDLNVSQIKTQSKLHVFKKPDVGRTQEPIMEEVSYAKDAEQGNGQEDESTSSDGHFFYDDEAIDIAYDTQYDVHSSEDVGTDDDDDDDDDDFLVDECNNPSF